MMAVRFRDVQEGEGVGFGEAVASGFCQVCLSAEARYTCPRCALRYCTLPCYQHDKHSACSEDFYKQEVMASLKEKAALPEQRRAMMDMLQRFEAQSQAQMDGEGDMADEVSHPSSPEGLDLACTCLPPPSLATTQPVVRPCLLKSYVCLVIRPVSPPCPSHPEREGD